LQVNSIVKRLPASVSFPPPSSRVPKPSPELFAPFSGPSTSSAFVLKKHSCVDLAAACLPAASEPACCGGHLKHRFGRNTAFPVAALSREPARRCAPFPSTGAFSRKQRQPARMLQPRCGALTRSGAPSAPYSFDDNARRGADGPRAGAGCGTTVSSAPAADAPRGEQRRGAKPTQRHGAICCL
jgi:hypothetical protein